MRVAIGSAFRNASGRHIKTYTKQVYALADMASPLGWTVRIIAAEGDSETAARRQLEANLRGSNQVPAQLVDASHGGPVFGSTEDPARFEALTKVGNTILGAVRETDDVLLYVESDLLWEPATMISLIQRLSDDVKVVAPLVFAGDMFYDVFAFRKDGERFYGLPPYHKGLKSEGLTEVDSVGSCLAINGLIARQFRMPPGGVLVGWCDAVRKAGHKIWVDANLRINHPA